MIGTWGYLSKANEKKEHKIHVNPSKIYFPFMRTLLQHNDHRMQAIIVLKWTF